MIKTREIQQKAQRDGVRDTQIEKDYVLSWILWGVARHQALAQCLVFKGGTALKKIYFDDYRFSEDLDFTLIDQQVTNDQLLAWFDQSFSTVLEAANIPFFSPTAPGAPGWWAQLLHSVCRAAGRSWR